jgi:hypothetical protein
MSAPSPLKVMKLPSRALIVLAIPFCLVTLSQRANSQIKTESKAAEATVSGKVTIKGKPAAGIVVGMRLARSDESSFTYKARTDQEGNYRMTKVASGSYVVAPVAPAFVIADSGNSPAGQKVLITESENVDWLNFDLVPGGVITGKVIDPEGRPLIEGLVILTPTDERGQRQIFFDQETDDRGVYRFFGVPAGRYKVSVEYPRRVSAHPRQAPVQTFYPDVTDIAKADVVEVKEGSEANKVDITIGETPRGYSVMGRVVDGENGMAVSNAWVSLSRIEVIDANSTRRRYEAELRSDAQGQFRLTNIQPGKYDLTIAPPEDSNLRVDAPLRFDLIDQDISGLVVKTSRGASVAGTVVFEGSKNSSAQPLPQMWLSLYTRSDSPKSSVSSSSQTRVKADGTFFAGGLPAGIVNFQVEADNNNGFTLTRVERDGVAQPSGIQIQNGENVSGLRLVMTFSSGAIRGVVRIENGALPPTGRIIIQVMKADEQTPLPRGVEVDARGHFLIESLPAGSYELQAMAYAPEWQNKRSPVRQSVSVKQIVTVSEGAASEVALTLDFTPVPNQ